jgi:glycosyltransferase involved in cell wall biosynthesis
MKVLVYFNPGAKNDLFEGTRMRKNIKAALELNSVSWVESVFALPDIVHLFSPEDEAKAHDAKEDGLKVVVSALYAEEDPACRYFNRDSTGAISLKPKALRLLSLADLILVPTMGAQNALYQCGVSNPNIKILTPGVNLARFEKDDPIETSIFPSYMRRSPTLPYVISVGDFEDTRLLDNFQAIAEACPKVDFYFFGSRGKGVLKEGLIKKYNRESSKNAHYSDAVEDDVYRSGMMGASVFLSFASHPSSLVSLEALASKSQIICYGRLTAGEVLIDKKNCYAYPSIEKTAKAIDKYCLGQLSPTIIEGYRNAKAASLLLVGKQLKAYYESILKDPEE